MRPASPPTVQSALASARRRIDAVDARALLTAVLGRDAAYLIAHADQALAAEQALTYESWVERRARGEPIAYIVGAREFYGRSFRVTPDVLIPRPETELLVEAALGCLRGTASPAVLDLGTGSGCIAITIALEQKGARVTAVDRSAAALAVARANALALGAAGIDWRAGDWLEAVGDGRYDLIVSNPPYVAEGDPHLAEGDVRFEPRSALTAGADGLDAIRRIVAGAGDHLGDRGWLWLEHGYDQAERCRALLADHGYAAVATHHDLAGIERVTGGRRTSG